MKTLKVGKSIVNLHECKQVDKIALNDLYKLLVTLNKDKQDCFYTVEELELLKQDKSNNFI